MHWNDARPRHIRDSKTRGQEDTLQVTVTDKSLSCLKFQIFEIVLGSHTQTFVLNRKTGHQENEHLSSVN